MDRQVRALVGKGSELYIVDQGGQYQKQVHGCFFLDIIIINALGD